MREVFACFRPLACLRSGYLNPFFKILKAEAAKEEEISLGKPTRKRNPPFPSQAESGIIGATERPSQTFNPKMPACSFAGLEHIFLWEVPFHGA